MTVMLIVFIPIDVMLNDCIRNNCMPNDTNPFTTMLQILTFFLPTFIFPPQIPNVPFRKADAAHRHPVSDLPSHRL